MYLFEAKVQYWNFTSEQVPVLETINYTKATGSISQAYLPMGALDG